MHITILPMRLLYRYTCLTDEDVKYVIEQYTGVLKEYI